MTLAELPAIAAEWASFMGKALLDGTVVFVLVALLWLPLRRRASAQLGYGLFLLVLLEVALPLQVPVPGWLAALSPSHLLQGLFSGTEPAPVTLPAAADAAAPAVAMSSATYRFGPEAWLLLAWIVVVTLLLARFSWLQVRTARIVARARRPRAGELGVDLGDLHRRIGLRRRVALRITDQLDSPAAGGLFRPYVLLPEGLLPRISGKPLRWVLLHELAHVRRRDAWVSLLQRLLQIAFFFHPAVWLANRILDEQREFACDDAALQACGESRRACGEGFLSVVEWAQATRSVPVAALGAFRSRHLTRRRLMRILDARRKPSSRSALLGGLFVAALGLLLVPNLKAQEGRGEVDQRIKQQEIAILKARLEKLRLESELLRMELQRLRGEGQAQRPRRGGIGRGRGLGGAGRGIAVPLPDAPDAPDAPPVPRRGRAGIGVPGPGVPDAAPTPRRRRAGLFGGAPRPGPEAERDVPGPRRRAGIGVPGPRGRADAAPRAPRAPLPPGAPRAQRGEGAPDARGERTAPERPRRRVRVRAPRARQAVPGRRGRVFGGAPEAQPPAPPPPPERRRRVLFGEFEVEAVPEPGGNFEEFEVLPEGEVLFEVEEDVPTEASGDVLLEVDEKVLPPESVMEIFEVPPPGKTESRETKPEPETKPDAIRPGRSKVH